MAWKFGISTIDYPYINQNPKMKILKIFFKIFAQLGITESCLLIPYYSNISIFIVRENEISTHFPPHTVWQKFFRKKKHGNFCKKSEMFENKYIQLHANQSI